MSAALQLVEAALRPSQYRGPYHSWDRSRWADVFQAQPDRDRQGYRCYIPFHLDTGVRHPPLFTQAIEDALAGADCHVLDIFANTALDKYKRQTTILKLLQKLNPELMNQYRTWFSRLDNGSAGSEYLICFSRHPYDVAGASTDRAWTSCISLDTGTSGALISSDVKEGAIVAYLIEASDRNLQKPLCRMTLRPYAELDEFEGDVQEVDEDTELTPVVVYPTGIVYGRNIPGFIEACTKWCESTFKLGHCTYHMTGTMSGDRSPTGDGPVTLQPGKTEHF